MKSANPPKPLVSLLLLLVTCLIGCGDSGPPRGAIAGRVSVGGAPLAAGRILFLPTASEAGPAASATIVNGEYKLPEQEGPVVGSNRVEIEAQLPLSFAIDDEAAFAKAKGKLPAQPIPPQFNRQSQLSVDVKAGEENRYDVEIPSARSAVRKVSY